MGWSSGTYVIRPVIESLKREVKDKATRKRIYADVLEAFESADWDNQDEVYGMDDALDELLDKR